MGALTGNAVQDSYLDLVQLGKSGAGLPSHAGKEAALYDGSGAQVCGRTAVRNWLDPHPDAIAGSYEFSTMGDMTQGELEAAGWTFDANVTGVVSGGSLDLTFSSNGKAGISSVVSLDGDFDYMMMPSYWPTRGIPASFMTTFFGVGDTSGDVGYGGYLRQSTIYWAQYSRMGDTFSTLSGGTSTSQNAYHPGCGIRISRVSGTVYVAHGDPDAPRKDSFGAFLPSSAYGWEKVASASDSRTFNRLWVGFYATAVNGCTCGVNWIRRYV